MSEFDFSQLDQSQELDLYSPEQRPVGENKHLVDAQKATILSDGIQDPAIAASNMFDNNVGATVATQVQARMQPVDEQIQINLDAGMQDVGYQLMDTQSQVMQEPDYVERAVVETLSDGADEQEVTAETARLYAHSKIQEMLDEQGIGGDVLDFAGTLLPFAYTLDANDVADQNLDWTQAIDLEGVILDYQSLSPEEKVKVFPGLMEAVLDATATVGLGGENRLRAAEILGHFLNPQGELDATVAEAVDIGFSALDVVPVGAVVKGTKAGTKVGQRIMGAATAKLKGQSNTAAMAAKVGNKTAAADASIAAARNPTLAQVHGLSRETAGNNALALNRTNWDFSATPEINDAISVRLNEFVRQSDELTRSIIDDQQLARIGALNDYEKAHWINNWQDNVMREVPDQFNEEVHVMNMRIGNVDEVGFTATYDIIHKGAPTPQKVAALRKKRLTLETKLEKAAAGERAGIQADLDNVVEQLELAKAAKPQRVDERVKFTVDENGNFNVTAEESTQAARAFGSPSFWSYTKAGGDFNDAFKRAGVSTDLTEAFGQRIEQMVKEAWKPISGLTQGKSRQRVSDVLLAADTYKAPDGTRGIVYQPHELIAGVQTPSGTVRLTDPNEIDAYYRIRAVADNFWRLENHGARRSLELLGFDKSVRIGPDNWAALKPITTEASAKQSVRNRSAKTGNVAYDKDNDTLLELTDEVIEEEYAKGRVLTRTSETKRVEPLDADAEYVDYVFVNRDSLQDLPEQVIHFKRGYIPKINKGVEYLVKETISVSKRGASDAATQKTLRFFSSKLDAERFADQMAAKAVQEGRYPTLAAARNAFEAVADRELTTMQRLQEQLGSSGGLFTGARSSDDILTGNMGEYTERVNVFEAMSRNARHLGSLVSRNELRIGEEARWLNTLDAKLPGINQGFLGTRLPDDRIGRAMSDMRNQIKAWNGVPQKDESAWEGIMQNLHDWVLEGARKVPGLQNKDSVKSIMYFKHKDLAAAMKTATMHIALGVLSPAQLFVQSAAMLVAVGRYPKYAHHMVHYGFRMGMADLFKDTTSLNALTKHLNKVDDATPMFDELYDAWSRSGLRESVRSNADLTVAENYGFMTARASETLGNMSLALYRNGELMNRRAAFITSYLAKRDELGRKLTAKEITDVTKDANLSMLELNAANRAWWQGGPSTGSLRQLLGVMTQFQQVSAKSIELMFKGTRRGGFTAKDKIRIAAAQIAFLGVTAVPFGGAITKAIMEEAKHEVSQDELRRWEQGIFIGTLLNALDMDNEVTTRLAAFGTINQFVEDIVFDDAPMIEKVFGASNTGYSRMWDAVQRLKPLAFSVYDTRTLTKADMGTVLSILGDIPSSSRNALAAWLMNTQHVIRDRHGRAIDRDNYSLGTEIGKALGFAPSIQATKYAMDMASMENRDHITAIADTYTWLANQYIDALDSDDPDVVASAANRMESVMAFLIGSTKDDARIAYEVRQKIQDKMLQPETQYDRRYKEYMERQSAEDIYEGALIDRRGWLGEIFNTKPLASPIARELDETRGE